MALDSVDLEVLERIAVALERIAASGGSVMVDFDGPVIVAGDIGTYTSDDL